MPIFGVDVSHHQGPNLRWPKIRGSGIDFMFARASLATTPDEQYKGNHARAKDAGIPVLGAYHFLYPEKVVAPAEQARLFVKQIGNPTGLLTMLDVERDGQRRPRIHDVRAFAAEFDHLTGGHPLLMYAPAWYWHAIGDPPAADLGRLVASHYVAADRNANGRRIRMTPARAFGKVGKGWWHAGHGGWERATILQFTSYGKVEGHPRRLDVNAFRGTVDELAALAFPAGAKAPVHHEPDDDLPEDEAPDDSAPDEGLSHGSTLKAPARPKVKRMHTVVSGDTLIEIASAFGWKPAAGRPAFRVMLDAFPENQPFRAHPESIKPGQRVRVG